MQRLGIFNDKLKLLEGKIYNLALEQNQIALQKVLDKENDTYDYNIDITYYVHGNEYMWFEDDDDHLLATWTDRIKALMMKENCSGINDGFSHNITSIWQKDKELNLQKHCWILHSIYEPFSLDWDDIFMIDKIYYIIDIRYDCLVNISA